ncbi:HIT family hydrolase [Cryptosporangium sp. NPDC048952]|uniref:HIT family hydrolase n=1 Tax=Cryptosporangium sp. NPDC048952 TaxID=3363961 RepID=UPI003723AF5D
MDSRDDPLAAAERGENPTVLGRLRTGWAVIGDTQHLPGYCLLLYAGQANHLTDLPRARRTEFLFDLALLGEVVAAEAGPGFRRINYEVLGNSWEHLHGHVHARYSWEPDEYRGGPVWRYPDRDAPEHRLGPSHAELQLALARRLAAVVAGAY